MAAEFQGVQHAWFPNPVHKSRTAFEVKRGTLKQMLCQEHGIWLILVPHTVTSERMTSFLREALDESKHESWPPPGHEQYAYSRHQHLAPVHTLAALTRRCRESLTQHTIMISNAFT